MLKGTYKSYVEVRILNSKKKLYYVWRNLTATAFGVAVGVLIGDDDDE
jgi:hypothetical protein